MTADEIAREITARAWRFGVAVVLSPSKGVQASDNIVSSGYFDASGDVPVLAVGWDRPDQQRIGTLLHEYCHLTQWVEDAPVWRADLESRWSDWLNGKRVRNIQQQIVASREIEADCERRTIRLIRELQAPVDLEQYARSANAYIHFYNVMAVKRKWYPKGRGPYEDPASMQAANPTLDRDFSVTPPRLWAAIEACLEG